jgi:tetratricopeptide (TPR) repeat protein
MGTSRSEASSTGPSSPRAPGALGVLLLLAVVGGLSAVGGAGCATRRLPPVSKVVNGRVVISRGISPEAYEHAIRARLYEEEHRWEDAAAELARALTFDDEAAELEAELADVFLRLGRVDDAAARADASLRTGLTVPGYLASARVAEARRDPRQALSRYQAATALARSDGDPEAIESSHLALVTAQMAALDVEGAYGTMKNLRDLAADSLPARLQLAALAWALGRLAEADAALEEALAIEPAEPDARLMLAALDAATGRTAEAKAAFREAINRSEESLPVVEMFLKWLVSRGDRSEAASEADGFTPDAVDDTTIESIVRIERAAGRPERAIEACETARKRGVPAARLALLEAGALADRKEYEKAGKMLLAVPSGAPEMFDARLRAAEVLRELGTAAALAEAERALAEGEAELAAHAPSAPPVGGSSGSSGVGSTGGKGTRAPPSTARVVPGLVAVRPLATAPGTADAGVVVDPGTGAPGRVAGVKPTDSAGAGDEDDTGEVDARDARLELAIGRALLAEKRGDATRAAALLDAAQGAAADDLRLLPRLLLVRAGVEERRGDWKRALEVAGRVLAVDPRNVEALNFHGFVSAEHGQDLPVTTRRLQIAVALDPGAGGIVDSLGFAYLQSGELVPAAARLTEADRLEPGDPEIMSHLGDLYVKQNDVARAVATYRAALTHEPPERIQRKIESALRNLTGKPTPSKAGPGKPGPGKPGPGKPGPGKPGAAAK